MQENAVIGETKIRRVVAPVPEPSTRPRRILLAEDDREMRKLVAGSLRVAGYEVSEVSSGTDLCRALAPQLTRPDADRYHVIVSDVRMPGASGLEILEGLKALAELPPIILLTAFGDAETHRKARELGAVILDKPFEIDDLLSQVAIQHQ